MGRFRSLSFDGEAIFQAKFYGVIATILVALKLLHLVPWSWWAVTSPAWGFIAAKALAWCIQALLDAMGEQD